MRTFRLLFAAFSAGLCGLPASAGADPCPRDMAAIPRASVSIGTDDGDRDERPPHHVAIDGFCLDRLEVSVTKYAACVAAGACSPPALELNWQNSKAQERAYWRPYCNYGVADHEQHPMNCLDWHEARAFCSWQGKRLPSEEEWEYAALGGKRQDYPWGKELPDAHQLNASGPESFTFSSVLSASWEPMFDESDRYAGTAPCGSYPAGASAFGVLDLAGNVWEWTSSRYCPYATPGCGSEFRVVRGGSFVNYQSWLVRSALRQFATPTARLHSIGFRCARGLQ